MRTSLLVIVAFFGQVLVGAQSSPASAASSASDELSVRAERNRRDASKKLQQEAEIERNKKSGEPFMIHYVEPRLPPGKTTIATVTIVLYVDETGAVRGIRLDSPPHPVFDWAVVEAAWQWRFSPKKILGKAVRFEYHWNMQLVQRPETQTKKAAEAATHLALHPLQPAGRA